MKFPKIEYKEPNQESKSDPKLRNLRDFMNFVVSQNDQDEWNRISLLYFTKPEEFLKYAKDVYKNDSWWDKSINEFRMIPWIESSKQSKEFMRNRLGELLEKF